MRLKEAKMSTALKSTDPGSISSVLKLLPAVLGSFEKDNFLAWNSAIQKCMGLSEDELARTPLSTLLILAGKEENPIAKGHSSECDNQLGPCVLKNSLGNVCDDGALLAMLDVTLGELVLKGFIEGRRTGCEEERTRNRHLFHDVLSCKMLVASFLAHEIYQQLAGSGAEQTEDMARLTKLLQEAIDAIVQGAEDNSQPNVERVREA
jgi:hypothetical protein